MPQGEDRRFRPGGVQGASLTSRERAGRPSRLLVVGLVPLVESGEGGGNGPKYLRVGYGGLRRGGDLQLARGRKREGSRVCAIGGGGEGFDVRVTGAGLGGEKLGNRGGSGVLYCKIQRGGQGRQERPMGWGGSVREERAEGGGGQGGLGRIY